MRPIIISKALTALDRDGISLAQQTAGAGDLTITGALASGGVFTSTATIGQRVIGIYSGGNLSARTFTVYGTDEWGHSISEAVTGPNATTVSTTQNFYTVTRVAVDGAVGTDVEVGTTAVGSSRAIVLDQYVAPFAISLFGILVSGAATYTVQYTSDDVFASDYVEGNGSWTDHPSLTGKSANADSNLAYPASAIRLKITAGTGTIKLITRQAGIGGV